MKQHHFLFLLSTFYSIISLGEIMEQIFKTLTELIKKFDNILIMTHKNPVLMAWVQRLACNK